MRENPPPLTPPVPGKNDARWLAGQVALSLLALAALAALVLEGGREGGEFYGFWERIDLAWGAVFLLSITLLLYRTVQRRRLRDAVRREAREHAAYLETHARLQELSALFQLSGMWNTSLPLAELLDHVTHRVASCLKAQHVSIMLLEASDNTLATAATYGLEAHHARHGRRRVGDGIAGKVALTRQPILTQGDSRDPSRSPAVRDGRAITSSLCAPILHEERLVGVLNVNRIQFPQLFDEEHLEILALFARQLGGAIDRWGASQRSRHREVELERELERVGTRIQEVDRLRDLFLATAGHEFRTPITIIEGAAEMLLAEEEPLAESPRSRSLLVEIRGAARQLVELVTDVIDLANIEAGRVTLHLESTELNHLVQSALESLRPIASRFGVTLEESYALGIPQIQADRFKLRYPLVQLLSGILRLTEDGGRLVVRTFQQDQEAVFEVESSGPVELTDPERALSLFGQAALRSRRSVSGLGIGFDLIRVLLDLHGGRMAARSAQEPGGLVVGIRFPLATEFLNIVSRAA